LKVDARRCDAGAPPAGVVPTASGAFPSREARLVLAKLQTARPAVDFQVGSRKQVLDFLVYQYFIGETEKTKRWKCKKEGRAWGPAFLAQLSAVFTS
jgi:hypothetical protein